MKRILINPDSGVYRNVVPLALAYLATIEEVRVIDQNTQPEPRDRFLVEEANEAGIFVRSVSVSESERIAETYKERYPKAKIKSINTVIDVQCCYPTFQFKEQIKLTKPFGDSYPFPDYSFFDSFSIWRSHWQDGSWPYGILTSLGCPFQCTYCAARNRGWKPRSAKNCAEELKQAKKKYKIVSFEVLDDAFNVDKARVLEFCQLVKPLHLRWIAANGLRADLFDEELAKAMKDSGCDSVCFGVESIDPRVLKNVKKGETFEQIDRAVDIANKYFRNVGGFFIIGLPGSSYEKDLKSVKWMIKKKIMGIFSYYIPPGENGKNEKFYGKNARSLSDVYKKEKQESIYRMVEFMQGPTTGLNFLSRIYKTLLLVWKLDPKGVIPYLWKQTRRMANF